jgi:hypothetical protein
MKQLEIYWHACALDYDDRLVPNISVNRVITNGSSSSIAAGVAWWLADSTEVNVRNGMLFEYNRSFGIYRCLADRSALTG